jgi:ABC-2 type transport system permease protein
MSTLSVRRSLWPVVRLEIAEVLRSRWILFCLAVYAVLAAGLVLVGLRESAVFGFTGSGRVLLSFAHALILLLPLLALAATGLVVNHARDDGTLELLLSHPISRGAYFVAITATRYAALLLPLLVLLAAVGLYGRFAHGEDMPWEFIARAFLVSAGLLWAFTGIGLLISTLVRHQTRAIVYMLLVWMAAVALLDFALLGTMLQWDAGPRAVFVLGAVNPIQAARMALLSAAEPELSVLGPVGFYLAHRIGQNALFALGVLWPMLLGTLAWVAAVWRFRKGDVV